MAYHRACQKVTGFPQLSVPLWSAESWVLLSIEILDFLIDPMVSTSRFQSVSGINCTAAPYITANALSSMMTSGGLALVSSASQAAAPSAMLVEPLLHHNF